MQFLEQLKVSDGTSNETKNSFLKILLKSYLAYSRAKDKRDFDVIKENHQFLWEENDAIDTWGKQIAKKYHDKLFKEYCICDLRKYEENKVLGLLL